LHVNVGCERWTNRRWQVWVALHLVLVHVHAYLNNEHVHALILAVLGAIDSLPMLLPG